jgi:hypothetical protein
MMNSTQANSIILISTEARSNITDSSTVRVDDGGGGYGCRPLIHERQHRHSKPSSQIVTISDRKHHLR